MLPWILLSVSLYLWLAEENLLKFMRIVRYSRQINGTCMSLVATTGFFVHQGSLGFYSLTFHVVFCVFYLFYLICFIAQLDLINALSILLVGLIYRFNIIHLYCSFMFYLLLFSVYYHWLILLELNIYIFYWWFHVLHFGNLLYK